METPDEITARIKEIMIYYKLNNISLFAEILNIRRPALVNIFAGRNYPSTFVIQTLLMKFPEVSPDYLLLGRGSLLRTDN